MTEYCEICPAELAPDNPGPTCRECDFLGRR
jgi:hypothetical protein